MEPIQFTSAGFKLGCRRALPLVAGLSPFAFVTGLITQHHGLTLGQCMAMNGLVYAGASQLLALANWSHPAPVLGAALAALVVNLRFALMGPVLAPWLAGLKPLARYASLAILVDHSWALSVTDMRRGGRDAALFIGIGVPLWCSWMLATTAGYLSASSLDLAPHNPLFFGALAAFVALLVPLWRGRADALPWAAAGLAALVVAHLLPHTSWYIVAGAVCGSVTGAVIEARQP
jgi:predicted branched-subunit amino acid permease